jgi:hypothetical protein
VQSEGLPVELAPDAVHLAAFGAQRLRRRDLELDIPRDSVELEPTAYEQAFAARVDGGALELGPRVPPDVHQLRRANVVVTLGGVGLEARKVDPRLDARAPRRRPVEVQRAAPALEPAANL